MIFFAKPSLELEKESPGGSTIVSSILFGDMMTLQVTSGPDDVTGHQRSWSTSPATAVAVHRTIVSQPAAAVREQPADLWAWKLCQRLRNIFATLRGSQPD